jgi:hypothetical protein
MVGHKISRVALDRDCLGTLHEKSHPRCIFILNPGMETTDDSDATDMHGLAARLAFTRWVRAFSRIGRSNLLHPWNRCHPWSIPSPFPSSIVGIFCAMRTKQHPPCGPCAATDTGRLVRIVTNQKLSP